MAVSSGCEKHPLVLLSLSNGPERKDQRERTEKIAPYDEI